MTNHYYGLGFAIDDDESFRSHVHQALLKGQVTPCAAGFYVRWAVGEGVELWVQADRQRAVVGMHPHFDGAARMDVRLTRRITRPGESPLEGGYEGGLRADEAPASGADAADYPVPLVFDVPDAGCTSDMVLPARHRVAMVAFAHDLETWPDPERWADAHAGDAVRFAAESFLATGLWGPADAQTHPAEAALSGLVLDCAVRTNPATGSSFQWARLRTLGGEVDLVADPAVVEAEVVRGGVVRGAVYLSGRVTDPQAQGPEPPGDGTPGVRSRLARLLRRPGT